MQAVLLRSPSGDGRPCPPRPTQCALRVSLRETGSWHVHERALLDLLSTEEGRRLLHTVRMRTYVLETSAHIGDFVQLARVKEESGP